MQFDATRSDLTVGVIGAGAMGRGIAQVARPFQRALGLQVHHTPGAHFCAKCFPCVLYRRSMLSRPVTSRWHASAARRPALTLKAFVVEDNVSIRESLVEALRKRCEALGSDGVFDKSMETDALMDYCLALAQAARE